MDNGDGDLIAALEEYEAPLRSYLYRFASNPNDVADLLQDTYARLLVASRRGDIDIHPIHAFLFRIARNAAIDWLRRRKIVPMTSLGDFDHSLVFSGASTLEEHASTHEELDLLSLAVAELPERCREVFLLRKVYGYSQKEIAARLNIQESTVESHVSVALLKLDEALSRGPIGQDQSAVVSALGKRVRGQ